MAIEQELTVTHDDDAIGNLCCQFPITIGYDDIGTEKRNICAPITKVKYVKFTIILCIL